MKLKCLRKHSTCITEVVGSNPISILTIGAFVSFRSIIIARIILNGWFSQCELNSDFLTLLRIAIKWDFPFFSRFLLFLLEFLSSHFSLFHYYYFLNVLVLGQLRSEKFGSIGQSKETLQWIGTKEALSRVRRGKLSTNSSANSSEIRKST